VIVSLAVLAVLVGMAVAAPWLTTYNPTDQDITARLAPPGATLDGAFHALGTDALGRDILTRIMFGARVSLLVGVCSVAVGCVLGTGLGLTAGFYGGTVDAVIMRVVDLQLTLPFLVLAIAILAVIGPGLVNVIVVLGITSWMAYARTIRAEVLSLKHREYLEAARCIGANDWQLILRHILPNVSATLVVLATFEVGRRILAEASLSYLGLGVQAPMPAWGSMVADGREYLSTSWWVSTLPGVAIMLVVLALNLLGDWLRERLDPRLRDRA
jgi:peptide/nickel transport system permease protein